MIEPQPKTTWQPFAERPASMGPLVGWRPLPKPTTKLSQRLGISAILILTAGIFVTLLYSPFERPQVHFVVLAPTPPSPGSIHSIQEVDLSSLIASQNAQQVKQTLSDRLPSICLPEDLIPINVGNELAASQIAAQSSPNSTLILYASGILALGSEPGLCSHSHDAVHANHSLNLIQLLRSLRRLDCKQVVLCIDVTIPSLDSASNLSTLPCWENLKTQLERELVRVDATPVAVLAHLQGIPLHGVKPGTESRLAKGLTSFLTDSRWDSGITLSDLQQSLTSLSQSNENHQISRFSPWLMSANWRMDDSKRPLPKLPSIRKSSPDGIPKALADRSDSSLATSNTIVAANEAPTTWSLDQSTEAQLDECTPEKLESFFAAILDSWCKSGPSNIGQELFLDTPLRRLDLEPYTFARLRFELDQLRMVISVSPDAFALEDLRNIAKAVWSIHQRKAIASDAPQWLKEIASTSERTKIPSSPSLLTNHMLSRYGLLDDAPPQNSVSFLDWYQALAKSRSTSEFSDYISRLPADLQSSTESKWAKTLLAHDEVDWPMLQHCLQTKLIGLRFLSDPIAIVHAGDQIQQADQMRCDAERLLTDRNSQDWNLRAAALLDESNAIFRDAWKRVTQACQLNQQLLDQWINDSAYSAILASTGRHTRNAKGSMDEVCQIMIRRSNQAYSALSLWNPEQAEKWRKQSNEAIHNLSLSPQATSAESSIESQLEILKHFASLIHLHTDHMERLLGTDGATPPRSSPFWFWLAEVAQGQDRATYRILETAPSLMAHCTQANLEQLNAFRREATENEWRDIDEAVRWWHSIAPPSISHAVHPDSDGSLKIACDPLLDLQIKQKSNTCLKVQMPARGEGSLSLQANYDPESVELHIQDRPWLNGQTWQLDEPNHHGTERTIPLSIRTKKSSTNPRPIVFVAKSGTDARRAIMRVRSPSRDLVTASFQNTVATSIGKQNALGFTDRLFANQSNSTAISVQNVSMSAWTGSCQLYRTNVPLESIPVGTLQVDDANRFLQSIPGLVPVAQMPLLVLGAGESKSLTLAPLPPPPDSVEPSFRSLLLEVRSPDLKCVQFFSWTPSVLNPQSYCQCDAQYDADRQLLTIDTRLIEDCITSQAGTTVRAELLDATELQVFAATTARLDPEHRYSQIQLSTVRSPSKNALLCVSVDGWKYRFIARCDLTRSGPCRADPHFAALRLSATADQSTVPSSQSTVDVRLTTYLSDIGGPASPDRILVGLDRNADRKLDGDPALEVRQFQEIQFLCQGVNALGGVELFARVDDVRLSLPIQTERNRWVQAIAVLERGNRQEFSNLVPFALDASGPRILSTRILGSQPSLLGTPLQIEVEVDDEGLSGVGMVEGGWSLTGDLHITESMTIVPAVFRDRNRWLLTLPTLPIPSGKSVVMIRAKDRAGNVGSPHSLVAEILTQSEIDQKNAALTTQVRGRVQFYDQPLSNLSVRLLVKPKEDEKTKPTGKESDEPAYSNVTTADGKFFLDAVRSGEYILECRGVVRGMRETRQQPLSIDAKSGPVEVPVQWNKKP